MPNSSRAFGTWFHRSHVETVLIGLGLVLINFFSKFSHHVVPAEFGHPARNELQAFPSKYTKPTIQIA